jgi:hypothetical protein
MYQGFAQSNGWRVETMSISETEAKGIKEVAVSITGEGSFARLKYESGVHRVQRVRRLTLQSVCFPVHSPTQLMYPRLSCLISLYTNPVSNARRFLYELIVLGVCQ